MIEVKVDSDGIKKILNKFSSIAPSDDMWKRALDEAGALMERKLKANVSNNILKVRTGNLRRSLGWRVDSSDGWLQAIIGSGVREGQRVTYADILETGGTIRPINAKYLTIPTEYAKTPSGVAKFTAKALFAGLTNYKTGVVLDGKIYGVLAQATRTKLVPLFILKSSVTIPAKRWMSITAEENANGVNEKVVEVLRRRLDGNA